jgi:hypothetical protein
MINKIELSDEQLAEVSGAGSRFNATQFAANFGTQSNFVDGSTTALLIGGGKKSNNLLEVQGSTNNVGNTFVGVNSNSIGN